MRFDHLCRELAYPALIFRSMKLLDAEIRSPSCTEVLSLRFQRAGSKSCSPRPADRTPGLSAPKQPVEISALMLRSRGPSRVPVRPAFSLTFGPDHPNQIIKE